MRGFIGVLFLLGCAQALSGHALHLSVSEVNYNRDTERLEVALRCFPDDLEAALTRQAGRPITVAKVEEIAAPALAYLRATWLVKSADGKPRIPEWAGLDITDTHVWLFFEVPLPGGLIGARLEQKLMQDLFDDQLNSVKLRDGAFKQTLVFARGDKEKVVALKR